MRTYTSLTAYQKAELDCGAKAVCGASGSSRGYDCLDITVALDSCGGCGLPNSFQPASFQRSGVDCSLIEGVADVECRASFCNVSRCQDGWKPSTDARSCERLEVVVAADVTSYTNVERTLGVRAPAAFIQSPDYRSETDDVLEDRGCHPACNFVDTADTAMDTTLYSTSDIVAALDLDTLLVTRDPRVVIDSATAARVDTNGAHTDANLVSYTDAHVDRRHIGDDYVDLTSVTYSDTTLHGDSLHLSTVSDTDVDSHHRDKRSWDDSDVLDVFSVTDLDTVLAGDGYLGAVVDSFTGVGSHGL